VARAGPLDRGGYSWPGSGRELLEVRGQEPKGGGRVETERRSGTVVGGRGRRDVVGRDFTTSSRSIHQLNNGAEIAMSSFRNRIRACLFVILLLKR
jgi:hypothetical protein